MNKIKYLNNDIQCVASVQGVCKNRADCCAIKKKRTAAQQKPRACYRPTEVSNVCVLVRLAVAAPWTFGRVQYGTARGAQILCS